MKLFITTILIYLYCIAPSHAQDTTIFYQNRPLQLTEVVINNKLDVPAFIERVKKDTSFYKAFRNLHLLQFTALNDIRMQNKKNKTEASLQSRTRQIRHNRCRSMQILDSKTTGDFYTKKGNYNYYTAELYAGLFFTEGSICGETNVIQGHTLSTKNKTGMNKHKEQLKMLFFNPGQKIPGIPLMGNKIALFDEEAIPLYDFSIDYKDYAKDQTCYVFTIKPKANLTNSERNKLIIDEMITWFDAKTMDIVYRSYALSYNAGIYDFDVTMDVQLTRVGDLLVPNVIKYNGNWHVLLKGRERGIFTATLFDFK